MLHAGTLDGMPNDDRNVLAPQPTKMPRSPPVTEMSTDSMRNCREMTGPVAPTAIRRPISFVRSVTGGLLGIFVGCGASAFLSSFGMPSSVPAWSIYVSFLVCVFIGVLFGYIPAQKAANMDPIEAIRHE